MLDRAERISRYLEGKSQADFFRDGQLQDSVLHCFLILGEAASQITEPTQERYSQLPWRSMVGIRNHIVHGYTRLDLKIIWETTANDLPLLIAELCKIVPSELI